MEDRADPEAEADPEAAEVGRADPEAAPETGVVAIEVEPMLTVEVLPETRTCGAAVTMRLLGLTPFEMVE